MYQVWVGGRGRVSRPCEGWSEGGGRCQRRHPGLQLGQWNLVHLAVPVHPRVAGGLPPAHWLSPALPLETRLPCATQTPGAPGSVTCWHLDLFEDVLEQPQFGGGHLAHCAVLSSIPASLLNATTLFSSQSSPLEKSPGIGKCPHGASSPSSENQYDGLSL